MYSWNKTKIGDKDVLTVFIDGQPKTISSESLHFNNVKQALLIGDWKKVSETIDKASSISRKSNGFFEVINGAVVINGENVPQNLGEKILELHDGDWPFAPFIKFWENLLLNTSKRAVDCLYDFLAKNPETSFTEDGCFIAYKGVGKNYLDMHTRTIDNSPGKTVTMPRNKVDEDPNVTCSHGLHAAAWGYANGTAYGKAEHYLMLKINPRDVVAVPSDYNFQKMRVCEYLVLKEIESPIPEGQHYVSNLGDEFEDDEFEDDEFEDDEFEDDESEDDESEDDESEDDEIQDGIYRAAVIQDAWEITCVPKVFLTEDLCKIALIQDGSLLEYIPEALITEELCKIAVGQKGYALEYVPKELRTEEICKIAVTENSDALCYVPKELIIKDIFKIAVSKNGNASEIVSQELKTYEDYKKAVSKDGNSLQYVPTGFITEELCKIAVSDYGYALCYVPGEFKTKELCNIAVNENSHALQYVPTGFITEELCKIAVSQNGYALQYVPEELKEELYKNALIQDGSLLEYIPEEFKTAELCKIAVTHNWYRLQYVPKELRTEELCKIAVSQNSDALCYVPNYLKQKIRAYQEKADIILGLRSGDIVWVKINNYCKCIKLLSKPKLDNDFNCILYHEHGEEITSADNITIN